MEPTTGLAYLLTFVLVVGAAIYKHLLYLRSNMSSPGWFWFRPKNYHSPEDLKVFAEQNKAGVVHALLVRTTENWFTYFFGVKSFAIITHPDIAQLVLKNEEVFQKDSEAFGDMRPLIRDSLINDNGEDWRSVKEVVAPAFHFEYIKNMVPVFTGKAEVLFDLWAEPGKGIKVKPHMSHFTLDTLGLAAFNIDFDSVRGGSHKYLEAYERIFTFNPDKLKKDVTEASNRLTQMTFDIVSAKSAENSAAKSAGKDFLDRLLSDPEKLSQKQIRDNVFLFFVAGHETTAHALTWHLYFLGKYPEIQQQIRDEVDAVLKGNVPNSESVKSLTFLDMFIKESLRHRPSIANILSRKAVEDVQVGQYFIPKGTKVGLSIYTIHHLKEFWPEPDKFDPLRFTPERSHGRHPFAYMPFSLGRRNCIGNNFSLLEQKIFLSMLLQRFTLELNDKADGNMIPMVFSCNAKNVEINLTSRNIPVTRVAAHTQATHA